MGATATTFARNHRATRQPQRVDGKGSKHLPKLIISEQSQILSDYAGRKHQNGQSLCRLQTNVKDSFNQKRPDTKTRIKRQLTPLQLLQRVRDWLPPILEDGKIDYNNMVRTCNKPLKRIRARIYQRLDFLYPKIDEGYSNDHGQIYMVAAILFQAAETQYVKEEVFKARVRGQLPQDP